METAVVTTKGQLVIPSKLRRRMGITEGTRIAFEEREGEVVFRPLTRHSSVFAVFHFNRFAAADGARVAECML